MTTYIAGPMTGFPNFNYPEFHYVAGVLRSKGIEVISPAELHGDDDTGGDHPWEWYLREALKAVLECDAMVMLVGWEKSRGARLERHVAEQLGMEITEWAGASRVSDPYQAAVAEIRGYIADRHLITDTGRHTVDEVELILKGHGV